MDHASTINFLSTEDTPELAPGFFIILFDTGKIRNLSNLDNYILETMILLLEEKIYLENMN
jgi:hypothetical protein